MGSRLEETLSKRMMVIETQTRALRQSSDDWKTMLEQQLEAVRSQLALLNDRITQNAGIPEAAKVAQQSPMTAKHRKGKAHPITRHAVPASIVGAEHEPTAAPSESNAAPANPPKIPETDSSTVDPGSPQ
jgi:hypothetical protein